MAARAERRLQTVINHLIPPSSADKPQLLQQHPTAAGELYRELEYSVMLPEKLDSGTWNVCRSRLSPLKLVSRFPDHPEIATLHDNFVHAVEAFRDNKYLGARVWEDGTIGEHIYWMSYGEVDAARSAIGSGLVKRGLTKGSCVGLYFINRPEWLVVDHACSAFSLVSVPLYDTLGPKAVEYVVKHVDAQAIFCTPQTLKNLQSFLSEVPSLRLIVVIGRVEGRMPSLASTNGVEIVSYSELYNDGLRDPQPFWPPMPDDVATILYTSGTTGTPKGVVLSHGNLIANAAGTRMIIKYYPSDIHMSYLPLAHIFERATQTTVVYAGGASGFYQGDTKKLLEDMVAVRPTVFCGVPRLYNRIYDRVMNSVKASGLQNERLFNVAYEAKKTALYNGDRSSVIWDQLVFNKLKDKLGGRVRLMISGSSPLSPQVMDFLRVCFGCIVIEGYGMSEASGSVTYMDENDKLSGHVGSPNPSYEIKLVDVPEMEYMSNDQPYPRGEICLRGPSVFQGYYKDETKTREVIDDDGWLHTGDIGSWLPGGQLKIIDRKKNIFKLAQGEYISPEKIENVYAKCKFVTQCFVYGESLKSALVAIVVVDHDVLKAWAAAQSIKFDDLKQLCHDHRTRAAVLGEMDAVAREAQLRGFEFAKAVKLELEPFSVENGLLTPTSKIKRPQAKEYFGKAIASLYDELSASDASSQQI